MTASEPLIGVTLLLGIYIRVAAEGGACLNLLYLLSGSIGVNPPMFVIELSIVLVGTTAGLIGLDRLLLPALRRRFAVATVRVDDTYRPVRHRCLVP